MLKSKASFCNHCWLFRPRNPQCSAEPPPPPSLGAHSFAWHSQYDVNMFMRRPYRILLRLHQALGPWPSDPTFSWTHDHKRNAQFSAMNISRVQKVEVRMRQATPYCWGTLTWCSRVEMNTCAATVAMVFMQLEKSTNNCSVIWQQTHKYDVHRSLMNRQTMCQAHDHLNGCVFAFGISHRHTKILPTQSFVS